MRFALLIIFIRVFTFYSFSQSLKLIDIDANLYPKIKLHIELPEDADTNNLILFEGSEKIARTISLAKEKNTSYLFFLIDYASFNNKEQELIFKGLAKNAQKLSNNLIDIGFTNSPNTEKCFFPLSYRFAPASDEFISFAKQFAGDKERSRPSGDYLECSIREAWSFLEKRTAPNEDKTIIILTKLSDFNQAKKILNIKSKDAPIRLKLICSIADTIIHKPADLFIFPSSQTEKSWTKIIEQALSDKDLTNLSSNRQYLIEFFSKSTANSTEVKLTYLDEEIKVEIERPLETYFLKETWYWGIIGVFMIVFIVLLRRIRLLQNKILHLKETVSLLFDKKMKILSKQTETPVLEIKLEDDFRNYHLKKLTTTIGRDKSCDVVIKDMTVSSHHATITNEGGEFFISDNESTNGIFVNDIKITKKTIKPGDIIRMGKAILTIHY